MKILSQAGVVLREIDGANLRGADLREANLREANLRWADLRGADLYGANLRGADLYGANLRGADLYGANLRWADLRGADLYGANLRGADLREANLRWADLRGADLYGANLRWANLDQRLKDELRITPEEGEFIGWKSCENGVLVKVQIPAKAKRSNATGRKCRAEYVRVLEVIGAEFGVSRFDSTVEYHPGKTVRCNLWDENPFNECSGGIHFFITKGEAERYSG